MHAGSNFHMTTDLSWPSPPHTPALLQKAFLALSPCLVSKGTVQGCLGKQLSAYSSGGAS